MTTALTEQAVSSEGDAEGKDQRTPLGRRSKVEINQTLLRVVGRESKAPALDVAAFQSFAD